MYLPSSHDFHVSFLSRVKINSANWPAPNVWVFIAQMVEHCSANLHYNNHYGDHIFIEICISAVPIIFMSHSFHGLRLTQKIGLLSTCGSTHPRRPRDSKSGPEKRCDESFQAWAEEPMGIDSTSKRSSECWLLIGHKKMLCIIVPNRQTVSPEFFSRFLTRGLLSRHSCPVHSPSFSNQKRRMLSA